MRILPVVGRELRATARRPSSYWVRSGAALAAFLAMAYVALIGAVGLPTGYMGRSIFGLLSLGAFAFCVVAGIRGASDALSQEKREGTLGLLFLTDLKGYDVVFGKLLSVSINSIYGILAVAPPLALAFMLGGTNVTQFVMMIVFLLNTLFLSLAAGMLVSTFSQHERPAMGGTLAIMFLVLVMPYAIAGGHTFGILEIWEVLMPGFLLASPIFAYSTIKDSTLLAINFDEVLLSLAFAHLAGWLCVVIASASIAQRAHLDAPRGKIAAWFAKVRHEWAYGKAERQRAIRGALLDRNAFAWLSGRDRLKRRYAWIFLALLGGLWGVFRWKAPEIVQEWPFALFSLWFIHLFFKVWIASEVAARFIEDRRSNALELLLTTPLKLGQFASGVRLALFRQFGAPIALLVIVNLFVATHASGATAFLIHASSALPFFAAGLVHLVFDLYTVHWVAIWRSLHLRGTNRTITQTIFLVVLVPVAGWFVMWQLAWFSSRGASLTGEDILWRWTIACVIYDLALAAIARRAFFRDFREAATRSFEKPAPFRWNFRRRRVRVEEGFTSKPKRLIFTRARKAAILFAILLVGINVIVAIRRLRLQNELSARIRQIRLSGLPFTQDQVARWRVPVTPAEGASGIMRRASRLYLASSAPAASLNLADRRTSHEPIPADLKRQISVWLRSNQQLFATLDEIRTAKPGGASFDERMRNSIVTDDLARAIKAKARVELEDDPAAAAQTISLMLHYARVLQGEAVQGFIGSRKALQSANELMQRAAIQGNFSAENWRAWKNILGQLDSIRMLRENLLSERADGFTMFSLPAEHLYQRFGRQFGDFPALFSIGWSIRRYFGQDKAEMIEYLDQMNQNIEQSTQPFWVVHKSPPRFQWNAPSLASATFIAPQLLPAMDWLFTTSTEMLAHQRILMTVCDVEIYRTEHGKIPDDLNILGPAPIDPFDGKPLRYLRRGNEYSLYSVSFDMQDNGGAQAFGRTPGDIAFHCGPPPEPKRVIK